MVPQVRRRNDGALPDPRLMAGSITCTALVAGLAAFGDIRTGNYLPGLTGWLLVAVLLQRAIHIMVHPKRAVPDDWIIPVAGTAWMVLYLLFNEVDGFYWCIPVLLAITLLAPSPRAGPVAGALCCATALATYPASGIEAAGTAGLLLACTAVIGSFASGRFARKTSPDAEDGETRWGSAATLSWESDGNSIHYSSSFKSMLGYSADKDHTPFNFFDLVHPDDRNGLERVFRAELRAARTGGALNGKSVQIRLMARDGAWRWVLADIVALSVSRADVSQCICSFVDITSYVVAQDALAATRRTLQAQSVELMEARESLHKSELARQDLYRLVPLAWQEPAVAAEEVLSRLQEDLDAEAAAMAIAQAKACLDEATRRTRWVIDLALMEQEEWHPRRKTFDVMAMAADAAAAIGPLLRARAVTLVIEPVQHRAGMLVLGEERYCRIALEALARDLAEAATAGSALRLSVVERSGRVGVELRHTEALVAARRAAYFDRPAHSGGVPSVSPYAARLILRAQGGDVVLGAPSRHGTSLLFMLEKAAVDMAPQLHSGVPRAVVLDVLVAGGQTFRQSVMRACMELPVELRHAPDGAAAIDAVIRRRPDVVVADAAGGLNGFTGSFPSIRAMQRDALEPASLWIAMGLPEGAQADGFNHCLADPSGWKELSGLLRAALDDKQLAASAVQVDPSLLKAMPQYVESRRRLAADLRDALEAGRRVEAARIAHLLGGSPGLRGFDAAVRACRAIGDLDSGEPIDGLMHYMDEVDAALERLGT